MATVQLSPMFTSIRGRVGPVVFRQRGEKLYMSPRPDFSRRVLTAKQQEYVDRFRLAVHYAQQVLADPVARQPFEEIARERRRSLYNTIISEYLAALKAGETLVLTSEEASGSQEAMPQPAVNPAVPYKHLPAPVRLPETRRRQVFRRDRGRARPLRRPPY